MPRPGVEPGEKGVQLHRSRDKRIIAGICGGLSEKTGLPATFFRVLFVASCVLPGPQILIYLIMWALIPKAPAKGSVYR